MCIEEIRKAIERYNRYRGVEARASLLKISGSRVYVFFEGSFCNTCGVNDWVEDFKYVLEDLGVESELEGVIEPSDPLINWRIGVFKLGVKRDSVK